MTLHPAGHDVFKPRPNAGRRPFRWIASVVGESKMGRIFDAVDLGIRHQVERDKGFPGNPSNLISQII
jgi:hypothetical protein